MSLGRIGIVNSVMAVGDWSCTDSAIRSARADKVGCRKVRLGLLRFVTFWIGSQGESQIGSEWQGDVRCVLHGQLW